MVNDPTEDIRRTLVERIDSQPANREELEQTFGQVWDTQELARDYVVTGFAAPYVVVRRKCDGTLGSLMFQHNPRYYFKFVEDRR